MRVIGPEEVDAALSYPKLIDILAAAFVSGVIGPPRHHHTIKLPGGASDATLLLMPAWTTSAPGAETAGDYIGLKAVSVFPDNRVRKLPAVQGAYVLFSARTGEPLALIDAPRLTAWRTAAASALAARSLARADASRLLVVGTGALAEFLIRAHASVRPIREVALWNRTRAGAEELAASLAEMTDLRLSVAEDLEPAVRSADIVSTATISRTPLVRGEWLQPGVHLDCVGAYKPDMRETDDRALQRARIWVDTRAGAFKPATSSSPSLPARSAPKRSKATCSALLQVAHPSGPRCPTSRCSSPSARRSRILPPPCMSTSARNNKAAPVAARPAPSCR